MNVQLNRVQQVTLGTALFTITNIVWIYLYSAMGIVFEDAFGFQILYKFMQLGVIVHVLALGFFLALAIFVLLWFFHDLGKNDRVLMATVGSAAAMFIGAVFYINAPIYLFIMAFYVVGCVMLAFGAERDTTTRISKLKAGWAYSNNVVLMLGIGALLGGMLFTFVGLPLYQEKTKGMMYKMVSEIVPTLASEFGNAGNMSRGEFDAWVINQFNQVYAGEGMTFETLSPEQQQQFLDQQWDQYQSNLASRTDTAAAGLITPTLMNSVLDKVPLVRVMFTLLPILTGIVLFSTVTLFGSICVRPFSALLGLMLPPHKEDSEEVRKLKEELEKKDGIIAALKGKTSSMKSNSF